VQSTLYVVCTRMCIMYCICSNVCMIHIPYIVKSRKPLNQLPGNRRWKAL